ncbi:hypothetical protein HD806DRAFT_487806 [Xylariaceae sp. AK1471]|nr:hypothetical protein HD806DRAFT_487454 [Xylariaceae sp. AK1471]KAI3326659.1 hypothetical protein HD806DRAFT_487806 [Xylariaceae sp. AK1471]
MMAAQAEDNFFLGPENWADMQAFSSGPIEHELPLGATASAVLPTNARSLDQVSADESIKNLLIMICARIDRIESAMDKIDEVTKEIRTTNSKVCDTLDQVSRIASQIQQTVDKLKEGMGAFSRTVMHYLKLMVGQAEDSD